LSHRYRKMRRCCVSNFMQTRLGSHCLEWKRDILSWQGLSTSQWGFEIATELGALTSLGGSQWYIWNNISIRFKSDQSQTQVDNTPEDKGTRLADLLTFSGTTVAYLELNHTYHNPCGQRPLFTFPVFENLAHLSIRKTGNGLFTCFFNLFLRKGREKRKVSTYRSYVHKLYNLLNWESFPFGRWKNKLIAVFLMVLVSRDWDTVKFCWGLHVPGCWFHQKPRGALAKWPKTYLNLSAFLDLLSLFYGAELFSDLYWWYYILPRVSHATQPTPWAFS